MNFFPVYSETVVLPYEASAVLSKLTDVTDLDSRGLSTSKEKEFKGIIRNYKFRISRKLSKPENFIPLIRGEIESTSKGCIIFTRYFLFFSSAMFLTFWSLATLLMSALFIIQYNEIIYGILALAAGLANYWFTVFSFHRQMKITRKAFLKVLN